jgi:hypothetical protein
MSNPLASSTSILRSPIHLERLHLGTRNRPIDLSQDAQDPFPTDSELDLELEPIPEDLDAERECPERAAERADEIGSDIGQTEMADAIDADYETLLRGSRSMVAGAATLVRKAKDAIDERNKMYVMAKHSLDAAEVFLELLMEAGVPLPVGAQNKLGMLRHSFNKERFHPYRK